MSLKKQLENRLQSLKTELASGQSLLAELEIKQANVRDMLLRISGAIQVLEEELLSSENDEPCDENDALEIDIQRLSNHVALH